MAWGGGRQQREQGLGGRRQREAGGAGDQGATRRESEGRGRAAGGKGPEKEGRGAGRQRTAERRGKGAVGTRHGVTLIPSTNELKNKYLQECT